MKPAEDPWSKELTPQETAVLYQRILSALKKDQPNHLLDLFCAVILSLATTCSAWCAYESTRWGGVQTFRLATANKEGRNSAAVQMKALQTKSFDASMFINFIQAKQAGDKLQEEFLLNRFRPEMRKAVDAWLKLDPFHNPKAPPAPFKMAEYVQQELLDAAEYEEKSQQEFNAAHEANRNSDTYVLLTVLFAMVLFFGGISGTVDARPLRIGFLGAAVLLFLITLVFLITMPICYA